VTSERIEAHGGVDCLDVELPPMPQAASRVLDLLNQPDTTAEDLRRVIETDPGLTTAVLRLVNSALFNLRQHISTVNHAITLLGFLRLRSLTLATVVAGLKSIAPGSAADVRDRIWEHSVNTAIGARWLADKMSLAWSEEAFVCGLLHDCGRFLLLARQPHAYVALCEPGHPLPSSAQERKVLGVDHQELGSALLQRWNQAPQIIEVVREHHTEEPAGDHAQLVSVVALVDRVTEDGIRKGAYAAAERLGIESSSLSDLRHDLMKAAHEQRHELLTL
jgi:putative nucleotidyltransferase with HDIG domain